MFRSTHFIMSFDDTYVDSAQKLVTLKTNYDHFLMDIRDIYKEENDFAVTFNEKMNTNTFTRKIFPVYNRRLKSMFMVLFDLVNSTSYSDYKLSKKIDTLKSLIVTDSAFDNYAGDLSHDERRIVRHLRDLLNKDRQFEKAYQEIVNSEFSLQDVGLFYSFNDLDSEAFQQAPMLVEDDVSKNFTSSDSVSWGNTVTEKEKELVLLGSSENEDDDL